MSSKAQAKFNRYCEIVDVFMKILGEEALKRYSCKKKKKKKEKKMRIQTQSRNS